MTTFLPANALAGDSLAMQELRSLQFPLVDQLARQDAAANMLQALPRLYPPATLRQKNGHRIWELVGLHFLHSNRFNEALSIFMGLYDQFFRAQQEAPETWIHKGPALCWILDCYAAMGFAVHAKRYLMLTLCEDAIRDQGRIVPDSGGIYFRAVWRHGMSDREFHALAQHFHTLATNFPEDRLFPEALLQRLDVEWLRDIPSPMEGSNYIVNPHFIHHLLKQFGNGTGHALERLSQYLMECMPGCRTIRRVLTPSTDFDIVCSMEGFEVDFRSEFGRYFLCECKDWKSPANFSAIAKFCRVLDSVKARFGVIFSNDGISGQHKGTDSAREILKYFQDSGKVIVVVDKSDVHKVIDGENFILMLRKKYEDIRLDRQTPT
jgi:hypothetical protein